MCGEESTSSSTERSTQVDSFDRTRPAEGATPTGKGHTDLSRDEAFDIAMNPFADSKLQSPAEKAMAIGQSIIPGGFAVGVARSIGLMGMGLPGSKPSPSGGGGGENNSYSSSTPKSTRSSAKPTSRVAQAVAPSKSKLGRTVNNKDSTILTGPRGVLSKANVSRKSLLGA